MRLGETTENKEKHNPVAIYADCRPDSSRASSKKALSSKLLLISSSQIFSLLACSSGHSQWLVRYTWLRIGTNFSIYRLPVGKVWVSGHSRSQDRCKFSSKKSLNVVLRIIYKYKPVQITEHFRHKQMYNIAHRTFCGEIRFKFLIKNTELTESHRIRLITVRNCFLGWIDCSQKNRILSLGDARVECTQSVRVSEKIGVKQNIIPHMRKILQMLFVAQLKWFYYTVCTGKKQWSICECKSLNPQSNTQLHNAHSVFHCAEILS